MEGSMQLEQLVTTTPDGLGWRVNNERGRLLPSLTATTKTQINSNQTLVCRLASTGVDPTGSEREGVSNLRARRGCCSRLVDSLIIYHQAGEALSRAVSWAGTRGVLGE